MCPLTEICCVCGESVAVGTPLFANRVPELNGYYGRLDMGRQFPFGHWVCIVCDNTDSHGVIQDNDSIEFSRRYGSQTLAIVSELLTFSTRYNNGQS